MLQSALALAATICCIAAMPTIDQIVEHGGVTPAYARMILAGRKPSLRLALRIYDATKEQIGPLAGLNRRDIEAARKMASAA